MQEVYFNKIKKLKDEEYSWTSGVDSSTQYAKIHLKRHKKILSLCKKLKPQKDINVLDIGRSNLSVILSEYYDSLTTMGFDLNNDDGGHREQKPLENIDHIVFDLNRSEYVNEWPSLEYKFDLIVFSETVEHLPVAPEFVMLFLRSILKDKGLLILTTPNATSIEKRKKMLFGENPFEKIRFNLNNPGHFREYTKREIMQLGKDIDFNVKLCKTVNFALSKSMLYIPFIGLFGDFNCDIIAVFEK